MLSHTTAPTGQSTVSAVLEKEGCAEQNILPENTPGATQPLPAARGFMAPQQLTLSNGISRDL